MTVRAQDDGGTALGGNDTSAPQTLTIAVAAVNDTPGFTAGAGPARPWIDSGPHVVGGWADRHLGRTGEGGQAVSFSLSNDNAALFSAQPQVQPDWTLTYTPAAGVSGARHGHRAPAVDDWRNVGRRQRHQRPADVHDRGVTHRERGTGLHGRPGDQTVRSRTQASRRWPAGPPASHPDRRPTAARPSRSASRTATRCCSAPSRRSSPNGTLSYTPGGETRAGRPP